MPLYQLKNKINVFKTLDNKKDKKIKEQLFKSYIKFFILCNQFKDYRLIDDNLNVITNKEEYLNNESIYVKRKNIDIKMINVKTNEYFFVCCRYYDEEQFLSKYNLAEMHYQVNSYSCFHKDDYKNTNKSNIDVNNDTLKNKETNEDNDEDEFFEFIPDKTPEENKENNQEQKLKYKLGLFVKSKNEFLKKYNNSRNQYLKSVINPEEDVYDYQYFLNIADFEFKDFMLKTNKKEIVLRNYQQDIINQIKTKNNVLNVCPNIGLHFILSVFIIKNNFNKILVIETNKDFKWKNIFDNYYGFDIYDKRYLENNNDTVNAFKKIEKSILFISKNTFNVNYKFISKYNFDLIVCCDNLQNYDLINKLNSSYNIYINCKNVNIEDANVINFNYNKLKYYELRNHWKNFDKNDKYPNQVIIHPDFKDEKYNNFLQDMVCDHINFNELFEIRNNQFFNSIMVNKFISMFISNKEFTVNQNTVYENLYNTNYNYNLVNIKDSQFWILPENNFDNVSKLLVDILKKDYHYKLFDYLIISNTDDINETNKQILEKEKNILEHYYKGLIILTNGILDNKVLINSCSSIVFLHNNITYNEYESFLYKSIYNYNNKRNIVIIGFNTDIYQVLFNFEDGIHNFENQTYNKVKYLIMNNIFYVNRNPYINKILKKLETIINDYKQKLVGFDMYLNVDDEDDEMKKQQKELQNKFYDLQYKEIEYNKLKSKFYDNNKLIEEINSY